MRLDKVHEGEEGKRKYYVKREKKKRGMRKENVMLKV